MKSWDYVKNTSPDNGWKARHLKALTSPSDAGAPIALAFKAWVIYAKAHEARFESGIGKDYFLGPLWAQWGVALRGLLNGDCGGLDCGTLDGIVCDNLTDQGFNPEEM